MADQIEPEKLIEEENQGDDQLEKIYENKRKELDKIHQDLNELMARLNTFISDQDDFNEPNFEENETDSVKELEDDCSEKQDGPQEKELMKQKYHKGFSSEDIYICDGNNPPEVDWDTLAPFIQSVVGDLKKIRQLNQMTNSVMERIRGLAGKTEQFQNEEGN